MNSDLAPELMQAGTRIQRRITAPGLISPFHPASKFDRFLQRLGSRTISGGHLLQRANMTGGNMIWLEGILHQRNSISRQPEAFSAPASSADSAAPRGGQLAYEAPAFPAPPMMIGRKVEISWPRAHTRIARQTEGSALGSGSASAAPDPNTRSAEAPLTSEDNSGKLKPELARYPMDSEMPERGKSPEPSAAVSVPP